MAFRPQMTPLMERAASLTKLFGKLLVLLGLTADGFLVLFNRGDSQLLRIVILITVFNSMGGAVLWLLSRRMDRPELWAYIAAATMSVILGLQFLTSFLIRSTSAAELIINVFLRVPLVFSNILSNECNAPSLGWLPWLRAGQRGDEARI